MLKTSLYDSHRALGAKMISFGGWEMPRDYTGIVSEVNSCRQSVGIFDVSHMGEFRVVGPDSLDFVQSVTTNDASRLSSGKGQYSLLLNETGGVIDDIIVYRYSADNFLIVVNAGCKEKDWDWLQTKSRAFDVIFTDESDQTALIAVQGPDARSLISEQSNDPLIALKRFQHVAAHVAGISCHVARTGYTGEDGFELFCSQEDAPLIWDLLIRCSAAPCGLAARDVLRIEAAYPLYGHELNEGRVPLGLGIGWAIKTSKLDFFGRNAIISGLQDGIREQLVGLKLDVSNAIPRENQMIFSEGVEDPVGTVTSGTLSPTLGYGIALALVGAGFKEPGTKLFIDIRGRRAPATVTSLPFYRGLDHLLNRKG